MRREELLARNQKLIDTFLEIVERKVSIIDDYGDENWKILPSEIKVCVRKICEREGFRFDWATFAREEREALSRTYSGRRRHIGTLRPPPHCRCLSCGSMAFNTIQSRCAHCGGLCRLMSDRDFYMEEFGWLEKELEKRFRRCHEDAKSKPPREIGFPRQSGEEFEAEVAKLLRERGYQIRGTPTTGDQGADLIAMKNGRKIIIQVKRYQGPVGNFSVQEVIGAIRFYDGDEGWVITNSTFTASAKALAQKAGIKLIDGRALQRDQL